ncbi:PEP-CTERM sorting domain-containing protein [Anabaena cylindrica UHCC 0172]|uniref:PEP-CTERM sorting domain-containing protein n=1 Tax=Anabaena cylindrica TaxID=1165 RepID=UPI002B219BE8|nr:PEP-CTERM sorting domain-containing protein [Anabaena cylindrica]MEA5549571.1 PEP-CTERM sorting domain-containing protein [Anabaena cylindrica UHCC 0172]
MHNQLAKSAIIGLSAITLSAFVSSSAQATNLVTNGSFETTSNGLTGQLGTPYGTELPGWTYLPAPTSYDFIFGSGTADTTGSPSEYYGAPLTFWGSNNGGLDVWPASSPDGGNFLAVDPVYQNYAPISQLLNGLTVGQQYTVSFYNAAAQQFGFSGSTYDQWKVVFGGETQYATAFNLPNHGFSGWVKESLTFTANSSSQLLQFFATGGPVGLPPFVLLDGVSVEAVKGTSVPEPSSIFGLGAVIVLGLGIGFKSKLAKVTQAKRA